MTIDELNALTALTATDEVPVWDSEESGEPTKKITASNLAASVKSLASLPNTTEMNNAIAQSTANMMKSVTMIVTHNNISEETINTYNNRDFSKVTGLLIFIICNADGLRTFATTVIPAERFTNGNSIVRFINIDNNNLVPITLTVNKVTNTSVQAKISSSDFYYRIEAIGYNG